MSATLRRSTLAALAAAGTLAFALTACTTRTTSAPSPSQIPLPNDAGAEADASTTCVPPTVAFARSAVAIAPTRDHHVTFVREIAGEPWLYVLGGEDDDFEVLHDDIQRAHIQADGSLEPFEPAGKLPYGRAGFALAVVGDDVVLAGGIGPSSRELTDEILVGRLDGQGRLEMWHAGGKLPVGVQHATAVVVSRDVYIFGGTKGYEPSTLSVKLTVADDGTLSKVTGLKPLPEARSHHAAFVDRGAIYLVGGLGASEAPTSRADVIRADISASGELGAWMAAGTLPSPLSVSAVEAVGCSWLFLGGLDESAKPGPFSNRVLRGTVDDDGTFHGEPALQGKLNVRRGHVHQTPRYRNALYSVGGRGNDGATLGVVEIGTITE
jgi:hypothetical protein